MMAKFTEKVTVTFTMYVTEDAGTQAYADQEINRKLIRKEYDLWKQSETVDIKKELVKKED